MAGFKGLVCEEWGISDDKDMTELLKLLSEKVHPLALGNVYRARQQIETLAKALLKQHRKDENVYSTAIQKLTKELGSHDYLIFRKEACEFLGEQIVDSPEVSKIMRELHKDFTEEMELGKPFVPSLLIARLPVKHNSEGHRLFRKTNANLKFAVIESESRGDRYVQEEDLAEAMQNINGVSAMGVRQEIRRSEWESYS